MICKERDAKEHSDRDRFSKAGAEAEEKMAFYLRRSLISMTVVSGRDAKRRGLNVRVNALGQDLYAVAATA